MIKVKQAEIYLTEHELQKIVKIVEYIKKDTARRLKLDRGIIPIVSSGGKIRFIIDSRSNQESMEYYLDV